MKHDDKKSDKCQANDKDEKEREIIPGVTADMIKPFNPDEWTESMKEEFYRFTDHDYESLDVDSDESKRKQDTSLMSKERNARELKMNKQIWIGDTGASCNMTNLMEGLINVRAIESNITFGNGEHLQATLIGDKKGYVRQRDGTEKPILLRKVKYIPNLACNLLSISTALQSGYVMEGSSKIRTED